MARRKLSKRHIRNLLKLGGGTSYGISLPKEEIEDLGWRAKQKLTVMRYGKGLLIRDWEPGGKNKRKKYKVQSLKHKSQSEEKEES